MHPGYVASNVNRLNKLSLAFVDQRIHTKPNDGLYCDYFITVFTDF